MLVEMNNLIRALMLVASSGFMPGQRNLDAEDKVIEIGEEIKRLVQEGVIAESAQHKQWCLEQIATVLGVSLPEHEAGIKS